MLGAEVRRSFFFPFQDLRGADKGEEGGGGKGGLGSHFLRGLIARGQKRAALN